MPIPGQTAEVRERPFAGGSSARCFLLTLDAVLLTLAYLGSFYLRLGWGELAARLPAVLETLPVVLIVSLLVHVRYGLQNSILRYASLDTAVAVLKSVMVSVLCSCLILFLLFRLDGIPRTVFVIHAMAAALLVGGARLALRLSGAGGRAGGPVRRVLLYGAGDNAELILHGLRLSGRLHHEAAGLLDDDRRFHGRQIHGVKIHGDLSALESLARETGAAELWVCTPGLSGERFRRVYQAAGAAGLRVKVSPCLERALMEEDLGRFQEPEVADLLRRPRRSLISERTRAWIRGRRVLITGAGGSIGSELSRQVLRLSPESLVLCDSSELNLFTIHGELTRWDGACVQRPYLVDVRDAAALSGMLRETRPEVVFHAAAYKHVPLVELNLCEGVLTNVQGLYNVALAAVEHGARDFVFVSTDKAVRPASVMGATKRLGEILAQVLGRSTSTRFSAVRFGNVLGSSGSVIPIFQEQIRRGEPVTVTHPDMTRYFMLLSEAVELVIQAGSIARGGEVFVLDMGQPVRIADMARDLIRLMGKEPERDVRIRYTSPRPGERIHEELLIRAGDSRTDLEDVWIDGEPAPALGWSELRLELAELFTAARAREEREVVARLASLVPGFTPVFQGTRELASLASPCTEEAAPRTAAVPGGALAREAPLCMN